MNTQCPVCEVPIQLQSEGWIFKKIRIPKFCGQCGTSFHQTCPSCSMEFSDLLQFCVGCGTNLYVKTPKASSPSASSVRLEKTVEKDKTTAEDLKFLKAMEQDVDDIESFTKEMLVVMLRFNSINLQLHRFSELIDEITENSENTFIVNKLADAINSLDFTAIDDEMNANLQSLQSFICEMATSWQKDFALVTDSPIQVNNKPVFDVYEAQANRLSSMFAKQQRNLDDLLRYYQQLCEYYPRYRDILTRSGFWDFVFGFAAGFFGGELGVLGAELWDDWNGKSDKEFVEVYANACDNFIQIGFGITQELEKSTGAVFREITVLSTKLHNQMISLARANARMGRRVKPIYEKLHFIEDCDEDTMALFEIIISNLKDQGLSSASERNIRSMFKLA